MGDLSGKAWDLAGRIFSLRPGGLEIGWGCGVLRGGRVGLKSDLQIPRAKPL